MAVRICFQINSPFDVILGSRVDCESEPVLTSHDECNTFVLSVAISSSVATWQLVDITRMSTVQTSNSNCRDKSIFLSFVDHTVESARVHIA